MPRKSAANKNRPVLIVGNWKMYKTIEEALQFVETLAPQVKTSQAKVYLAVPFTALFPLSMKIRELGAKIVVGAQNMNDAKEGAFTGEIAGRMIKEAGGAFVLLGHSERRQLFHESDSFINRKVKRALEEGLEPILCVGETLKEREIGKTEEVLKKQLLDCLHGIKKEEMSQLALAYEPVWAIGTGKVAKSAEAGATHSYLRSLMGENWDEKVSQTVQILYGGSVKPENAKELLSQEDIDGLLVGGASLQTQSFMQIINSYQG